MNKFSNIIFLAVIFIIVFIIGQLILIDKIPPAEELSKSDAISEFSKQASDKIADQVSSDNVLPDFVLPFDHFVERITKKSFGDYISPTNSPIQPERFTGYHTGVDLEVFSEEEKQIVSIKAICSGPLIMKRFVSGYGGVAGQNCSLNQKTVSIIYGHLDLSTISYEVGDWLSAGMVLGALGQAYSKETDGERKHLHLGIYQGEEVDIRGYVSSPSELDKWLNPLDLYK